MLLTKSGNGRTGSTSGRYPELLAPYGRSHASVSASATMRPMTSSVGAGRFISSTLLGNVASVQNLQLTEQHGKLQKSAEGLDCEAGVTNDAAHSEGIHGIVPRNGEDPRAVGHNDVLALADNDEADFLERADRVEVVDAVDLGQELNGHVDFANLFAAKPFLDRAEILANGVLDVLDRFGFGSALRPAPGQPGDRH